MEQVISLVAFISVHWLEIVGAIVLVLNGIIGIAMILPGAQPETFLKAVVAFIEKFSKK